MNQAATNLFQVNRQTTKISPVETNPENIHSHKIARISSSRDDKLKLQKV